MPGLQRLVISPDQRQGQQLVLTPAQQRYLYQVLRLQAGEQFIAIDRGSWWLAQLQPQGTQAELLEPITVQTELPVPVVLIAALPKGSGFDQVITQATELGVSQIVPVVSERTLLQPGAQRQQRWVRLAAEAAEQSCRQQVPEIFSPLTATAAWQQVQELPAKYICAPGTSMSLLEQLQQLNPTLLHPGIALAVGPEGGWTTAELELATTHGFQPVSLGPRILRAVTAAPVVVAITAAYLERQRRELVLQNLQNPIKP